jgi:hypothetical protein
MDEKSICYQYLHILYRFSSFRTIHFYFRYFYDEEELDLMAWGDYFLCTSYRIRFRLHKGGPFHRVRPERNYCRSRYLARNESIWYLSADTAQNGIYLISVELDHTLL